MDSFRVIRQRRQAILDELASLEMIRRGSVTEQVLHPKGREGKRYECGPYTVYTLKRSGRTVSRRLSAADRDRFREQVDACHRFQSLTRELMEIGEALCDLSARHEAEKKTPNV